MKTRSSASTTQRPGVHLIAGLSALGLAAGLLTGCSNKDPDEGLCEEATKALESVGLDNGNDIPNLEKGEKVSQLGEGFVDAAEKYDDSEYAEPIEVVGKMAVTSAKLDQDRENQELQAELYNLSQQAAQPELGEKAKKFAENCPAFDED